MWIFRSQIFALMSKTVSEIPVLIFLIKPYISSGENLWGPKGFYSICVQAVMGVKRERFLYLKDVLFNVKEDTHWFTVTKHTGLCQLCF